jgi:hypothetical protein
MLTMAVGHSDDVDSGDAIAAVIDDCRSALGGRSPQAGILFCSVDSFEPAVIARVRDAFPGVNVMGSTSASEISSVNGYMEDSMTLALFASEEIDVTIGFGTGLGTDIDTACRSAAAQALAGTKREAKVCVMMTEAFVVDPQLTLNAMSAALPKGVVVLGGTSARNDFTAVTPSFQFANGEVSEDGVAIMLFSGPVKFSTAVGNGWRTLGPKGVVTRSEYGAVHEIDGRPAVEFLARYLDVSGPATYGNPLAVFEQGTDDFYIRAVPEVDTESGSVSLAGSIPVGAEVQLTTANTDDILGGTRDALERAGRAFPAGAEPQAALIFSCAVRKFLLGSKTREEAELAEEVLGKSIPVAGTYCYGEVGPVNGVANSRWLNETFVTLLLGE